MTPLEELRHSASHILATAVLRIYPDAKLDIGPPTDTGFYYDIDLEHKLTAEDLVRIEAEMKKVADENQPFLRKEVSREEAAEIIRARGQERYKLGRLADIPEDEKISFYQNGEFIDLCAGTHVRYTSKLKAFKLLSIAGAYHRGDEKNKQLQRIYGTAFPTRDELAKYIEQIEQAKHRDHRKLGRDLKLFVIDEDVGQAAELVAFLAAGGDDLLRLLAGDLLAQEGLVLLGDLLHFRLQADEVLLGQLVVQVDVIVEPRVRRGADVELGVGKEAQQGGRQDMGRRVAQFFERGHGHGGRSSFAYFFRGSSL